MGRSQGEPVRILVADEQRLFAEGVSRLLEPSCLVLDALADGRELLEAAGASRPELILTELSLFAAGDFHLADRLRTAAPECRVLVVGMETDAATVKEVLAAGACGYLLKTADADELLFAVGQVLRGRQYLTPSLTHALLAPAAETPPDAGLENAGGGRIRVLIVDDNETTQMVVRAYLTAFDDVEVVGEAGDGRQAVAKVRELAPDVVLMDLRMPVLDGVEATRAILADGGGPRVLALTGSAEIPQIMAIVRAGALGYLNKEAGADEIVRAIRQVHRGEPSLPPEITRALLENEEPWPEPRDELTLRELEVVRLIARGLANKEVAGRLHLSEATVRSHLRNVNHKLELGNRVELVLYALRSGWASLDAST
jgi:DNA-binding NarL/FixJ family response regulator